MAHHLRSGLLVLLVAVVSSVGLVAGVAAQVVNTGVDASVGTLVSCNGRVGFRTLELRQHGDDLNGDGDISDYVFQLLDLNLAPPSIINSHQDASGELACGGDLFAFGTSEGAQGETDLDGDGDHLDTVLQVFNAATGLNGTLTNVGLPVAHIVAGDQMVAFQVPEASLPPTSPWCQPTMPAGGCDLNGNGTGNDLVLFVYDPALTIPVVNVGWEAADAANIKVSGRVVAFLTSEAKLNPPQDLNDDGDLIDSVLQIYDSSTSTLFNSQRSARPDLGVQLKSGVAAFAVGDTLEGPAVLYLYCLNATTCNVVDPGLVDIGQDASGGFALSDDLVAWGTRERNQGNQDLNGDGDNLDIVVQYRKIADSLVNDTRLAVQGQILVNGQFIAFAVPEREQGAGDLDGDGDIKDLVVHIVDTGTGAVSKLGVAVSKPCSFKGISRGFQTGPCMATGGDVLIFAGSEKYQHADLNGDFDHRDLVPQVYDLPSGTLHNSGKVTDKHSPFAAGGVVGAFRISEKKNRGSGSTIGNPNGDGDLNGDTDTADTVIATVNVETGTTTVTGFAGGPFLVEASGVLPDTLVFGVNEAAQSKDLNGDSDRADTVLQYLQPVP
jgi:hypothetical protein